jgi:hypothetical protein
MNNLCNEAVVAPSEGVGVEKIYINLPLAR